MASESIKATSESKLSAYDEMFFRAMDAQAVQSAQVLLPMLREARPIRSVLDIGCGCGSWLKVWQQLGAEDIFGIDGSYLDPASLVIPRQNFQAADLSQPVELGRQFDLVQSLEVGEHIALEHADSFLQTITGHGKLVLFSAAVPGQGGTNHVNEQPFEFWRDRFLTRGYQLFDFLRPKVQQRPDVAYFYRFNALLFAHESIVDQLPSDITRTRIAPTSPVPVVAPALYRLRCRMLRSMSPATLTRLAAWRMRVRAAKHRLLSK